jgi:hypothetical protein
MSFEDVIGVYRRDSFRHGEFAFDRGSSLARSTAQAAVPNCAGVYVISTGHGSRHEILYVGKSGTVHSDGTLGKQGISQRLRKKQKGLPRQTYFEAVMDERGIDQLLFEWFETYCGHEGAPPFLAEAELLAAHLADHGHLPPLNGAA